MDKKKFEDIRYKGNLFTELWGMIRSTKKYWLIPLILILLGLAFLIWAGGTAAAPFIYTLF
ncbi:MAG: hypothetical protein BWY31_01883 [Lentisphaerae bacterium ADurb.Bin242]|nr:MAG: hypothetical protein BWY31_01883 [Lentisphaerae bacterium ADurb.Bin242]